MTRNSREYSRIYMAERRAAMPRRIRNRATEKDKANTWPGEGHCFLCHLVTALPDGVCVTCRWEIEVRQPTRPNEVEAA